MSYIRSRILALVLTFVMILGTVAVPVSAAQGDVTREEAAEYLNAVALLQGDDKGDLMLDKELTREQMMVIVSRLLGVEDEAMTYPLDEMTFKDVPASSDYAPYIAWAQANGITEGYNDKAFGFKDPLNGWQTKAFFVRALGYTDVTDSKISKKADDLGLTKGSIASEKKAIKRADMALLMYNTVYAKNSDGKILGELIGVVEPPAPPKSDLEITAKLASTQSIKVTFNRPVDDTSKITFDVRGTYPVTVSASWNAEKTEATLTSYAIFTEGIYTVRASGDKFAVGKDIATITVVPNGVAKIEFLGNFLYKASDHATSRKATLRYKITDNYGNDVTKTTFESDLMVFSSRALSTGNPFDIDVESGTMTLNFDTALTSYDTSVSVTILSTRNATVTTQAALTVTDAALVNTIVFKPVEYPVTNPATVKILRGKTTAAYIPIELRDQFGTLINSIDALNNDILFIKSDNGLNLINETYTDAQGNRALRLRVDTTGITTERIVSVTAISKLRGNPVTTTLDIKDSNKADRISFMGQTQLLAANDPRESLVIPMVVVDQYGVQLTPDEIVSNTSNITLSASGDLSGRVAIATSGENKGKIINTAPLPVKGTYIVYATTTTGKVATMQIEIRDAAYEATIKVENAPATNLLMDAVTKFNYTFYDQYGRKIKNPSINTDVYVEVTDANILKATVSGVSTSPTDKVLESKAALVGAEGSVAVTSSISEGTARVTAKLFKDGNVIYTADSNISVIKGIPSSLNFEIADMGSLPARTSAGVIDGTDPYARPVIVTGRDSSGTVYAIPNKALLSVTSTDSNLIRISSTALTTANVKNQEGYYVVAAQAEATAFTSSDPVTKSATVRVLIGADNGIREVTKTLIVSRDDPKASRIVFADKDLKPGYYNSLSPDAKEITDISGRVTDILNTSLYIFQVDQYGVYTRVTSGTLRPVNLDKFSGVIGYNGANLSFAQNQIKNNETVYVMYSDPNGVAYGTFTIRATDGTMQ